MNAKRVVLVSMLLLPVVQTAHAIPVAIQVDYSPLTLSTLSCSSGAPLALCDASLFSPLVSTTSTSLTFNLDESQRAVNGSYDVSSGIVGPIWGSYLSAIALPGSSASSFTASAIVQGGLVSDLLLNVGYTLSSDGGILEYAFTGSSGGFGMVLSVGSTEFTGTVEAAYDGTYDITQPPAEVGPVTVTPVPVPEPSTWLLVAAGLVVLLVMARSTRSRVMSLKIILGNRPLLISFAIN